MGSEMCIRDSISMDQLIPGRELVISVEILKSLLVLMQGMDLLLLCMGIMMEIGQE